MKYFTLLSIWATFLFPVKSALAQCNPPVNPYVIVNTFEYIAWVEWDAPTHSCTDIQTQFFQLEYASFPFTPGTGTGTLVSPVFSSFYSMPPLADYNNLYVWVRTICTCVMPMVCCQGSSGDGESQWVLASIIDVTPPCYAPPGASCSTALTMTLNTAENCNQNMETIGFCYYGYIGNSSGPDLPCSASSDNGFFAWRRFTAPETGTVQIRYDCNTWKDFGFRLLQGSCGGEIVYCEPEFTTEDTITVDGLIPGTFYFIGLWNNAFYFDEFTYSAKGQLFICESTVACANPTNITVSDITNTEATISWNANGSELWDLEYGDEGFTPGNGELFENIDANPYLISGLEPLTTYDVYLKSICEPNAESEQIGPVTFETGIPTSLIDNASIIHSFFPNPTTGQLNIVLKENGPVLVELFGMHGQRVLMQSQTASGFRLDLAHLVKGMYSIRLTTSKLTFTEKLILK